MIILASKPSWQLLPSSCEWPPIHICIGCVTCLYFFSLHHCTYLLWSRPGKDGWFFLNSWAWAGVNLTTKVQGNQRPPCWWEHRRVCLGGEWSLWPMGSRDERRIESCLPSGLAWGQNCSWYLWYLGHCNAVITLAILLDLVQVHFHYV